MSTKFTPGPWGIEQTRDMLWVGPMRPDGHKVDDVVVGLTIDPELTVVAALRQHRNAHLIAAAPDLYEALAALEAEKADYMRINNLGDPASEHTNKQARAALAKARGEA